jgi:hypothetical protein
MNEVSLEIYGFGLLIGGMVVWALVLGVRAFKKIKESKNWPKTSGIITQSSVETGFVNREFIASPKVTYEYEVDGQRYTSSQLSVIEWNSADVASARERAEKFRPGQRVDVYYDPKNPSFAILNRD